MLDRLFREHPKALGMTWLGHGIGAAAIGARMIASGAACIVHAFVPGLFTETAGRTVKLLHEHMTRRKAGATNPEQWPDYEI